MQTETNNPIFKRSEKNLRAQCANYRLHGIILSMAIAFARISYHSRSQGHSAVAGAAYRAGEVLIDQRTGEVHDFKNREDVVYSKILLPEGADRSFENREYLWNAVEAAEKRSNSQVAKDVILALPCNLDLDNQIKLAHNFADYHFVSHGVVADIAIHDHGDGNPHAHIYVTTRRLKGKDFDTHKARDLEPGVSRGSVVDPQYWGEQWRTFQNSYFQENEIDIMVDANHIISQRHEGRLRGNEAHYIKEENLLRREASKDIALNDPDSLVNYIGSQYSVFSDRDIASIINKNTDTPSEFATAMVQVKAHQDIVLLGTGNDGRDRYTTRANYIREATLADNAFALSTTYRHAIASSLVSVSAKQFSLNAEQTTALSHIANTGDISVIVGRAGTGKSYMMKAVRHMYERSDFKVRGIAVSGIASQGLERGSGIPSNTIFSFKYRLEKGSTKLNSHDVIVMDEAGMTDSSDMAYIISEVKRAGAKLILLGDHDQLQPVGSGAIFRSIIERIGFSELTNIQRQTDAKDRKASKQLSKGNIGDALHHYAKKRQVHLLDDTIQCIDRSIPGTDKVIPEKVVISISAQQLITDWSQHLNQSNISNRLILSHRRCDVSFLNNAARAYMQENALIAKDEHLIDLGEKQIKLSVGDRIVFLRNHKDLNVKNGELATVTHIQKGQISVLVDGGQRKPVTFNPSHYNHFDYGYATTVHKAQGVTVDDTYVYISGKGWNRFLSYVAMSRHRHTLNIYASKNEYSDIGSLSKTLSRTSIKDNVIDWPLSYAIRRGFDPESVIGRFINKVADIKQNVHDKWLFITNYEAFLRRTNHKTIQSSLPEQRNAAKKVAHFVDLRNALGAQARYMKRDQNRQQKLHQHDDYVTWYQQTLVRDKLAFEINKDFSQFEQALEINRVNRKSLTHRAESHERHLNVERYIALRQQHDKAALYPIAEKMQKELSAHYPAIAYFAVKKNYPTHTLAKKIIDDSREYELSKARNTQHNVIDWASSHLNNEFSALEKSNIKELNNLSKLRKMLASDNKSMESMIKSQLESVAEKISRHPIYSEKLKSIAPTLYKQTLNLVKSKQKDKDIEI